LLHSVVVSGQSLTEVLEQQQSTDADPRDRRLVRELSFGVLRWYPRLEFLLDGLLRRPLKPRDSDVRLMMLVGIYQLLYTRVPAHAAIDSTVSATRLLGKQWATGLVNGVLRNCQRRSNQLSARADAVPSARYAYPLWLMQRIQEAWPDDWRRLLEAGNERAPMSLRVNAKKASRDRYRDLLRNVGIESRPSPHAAQALILDRPVDVTRLPGFSEGQVSVQDVGAQLAAGLLQVKPGHRVLDACAAPGGKACHIGELAPGGVEVTAVDVSEPRLGRLRDNVARLGLSVRVHAGDALRPHGDWARQTYDRILLDAPCSATGVIRRHPDIKLLRRDADIGRLVEIQASMLEKMWSLLAPGGMLLFATCSLLPDENWKRLEAFLASVPGVREHRIDAPWGRPCPVGRQTLPGEEDMDGFYYARLIKAESRE
jgi:16S rRNA (cytosine967-C5)-methyltransferase